jgi:mannose-1-phosphate guanylyltransferase/mannose-1-phosphate guanylyltransferase/phosphomannomutase
LKAVILAAGRGTRLGHLTESLPKPLIQIRGKSILEHNVELCRRHGISEMFVNTHYLAQQITSTLGDGKRFGVTITYSYEQELLGTAGALCSFKDQLLGDPFYVVYGDNFSDYDLHLLRQQHEQHHAVGTIGFHYREDVAESGVAEFDGEGRIIRFVEKPKPGESQSRWVNAGIYYLSPQIFNFIPPGYSDFAKDIFPRLVKSNVPLYGVCEKTDVAAFDTPQMYESSVRKLK